MDLPSYAFQHGCYWLDESASPVEPDGLGLAAAGHPLLGAGVESALPGLSLRGGSAVPQPESGQRQARECYQRACHLKGVVV